MANGAADKESVGASAGHKNSIEIRHIHKYNRTAPTMTFWTVRVASDS